MRHRTVKRWLTFAATGALVTLNLLLLAPPADAASSHLLLPFGVGQTWFVCQGYNTPQLDHVGSQVHALDLSIAPTAATGTYGCVGGPSASKGQPVYAPAAGTIVSHCCNSPVDDMVCIASSGGGSLRIGHMHGLPAVGAHVAAGAQIGIVNGPGVTTNEGKYAHIHVAAYSDNSCGGTSIPFADARGTRFVCAPNLPDLGSSATDQDYGTYLSRCGTIAASGTPSWPSTSRSPWARRAARLRTPAGQ